MDNTQFIVLIVVTCLNTFLSIFSLIKKSHFQCKSCCGLFSIEEDLEMKDSQTNPPLQSVVSQ